MPPSGTPRSGWRGEGSQIRLQKSLYQKGLQRYQSFLDNMSLLKASPYKGIPVFSERDDALQSEGSLDPLGLYPLADKLALRLAPGVRERQSRPRFLTIIAISHWLCQRFNQDTLATDLKSPPWQVFEWFIVEGLVRNLGGKSVRGLPGIAKAKEAILSSHLKASNYLKTPSVFGFHGVYRTLAKELNIENEDSIGENALELIQNWERDQGLAGFLSASGRGAQFRKVLDGAIDSGLRSAASAKGPGWEGWLLIGKHLDPTRPRARERNCLTRLLMNDRTGHREELCHFIRDNGTLLAASFREEDFERNFHESLLHKASPSLTRLIKAIHTYEAFSRLCTDSFNAVLGELSRRTRKTDATALKELACVSRGYMNISDAFNRALEALDSIEDLQSLFQTTFAQLKDSTSPQDWVTRLIDHHKANQKRKPPTGKAPWIETFDDGSWMVRPHYRRGGEELSGIGYVNRYRTVSLLAFLQDLKLVDTRN